MPAKKPAGPSAAALKKFEDRFAKVFGADTLQRTAEVNPYEVISTGSLTLDYRLSVGGIVEGRLNEWWGPDGIGKTTMCIIGMAEAQRKHPGKMVAFIDMEQKFDKAWAVAHGVNLERLYLYTPASAEDVADAAKEMVRSGLFADIVIDSIGAMIPEAEKEKDADEAVMAAQAKIVTRMVKILAVESQQNGTCINLINQVRANLGYGADTTTGGGFALRHSTTMKFKMRRTGTPPFKVKMGSEDRIVGHEIAITVERNGVGPAYRTAIITLFHTASEKYGPIGIDVVDEAATLGIDTKVIGQSGAWYTLPGGARHNGKDKMVEALRGDPGMVSAIRTAVLASVAGEITEETVPEDIPQDGPKFRTGAEQAAV
jgi:recombination protein RecA